MFVSAKIGGQILHTATPPTPENTLHCNFMQLDHGITASIQAQLTAALDAWQPILSCHKDGEPSIDSFEEHYGSYLNHVPFELSAITSSSLLQTVKSLRNSAPGMDSLYVDEIKTVLQGEPIILDMSVADVLLDREPWALASGHHHRLCCTHSQEATGWSCNHVGHATSHYPFHSV